MQKRRYRHPKAGEQRSFLLGAILSDGVADNCRHVIEVISRNLISVLFLFGLCVLIAIWRGVFSELSLLAIFVLFFFLILRFRRDETAVRLTELRHLQIPPQTATSDQAAQLELSIDASKPAES